MVLRPEAKSVTVAFVTITNNVKLKCLKCWRMAQHVRFSLFCLCCFTCDGERWRHVLFCVCLGVPLASGNFCEKPELPHHLPKGVTRRVTLPNVYSQHFHTLCWTRSLTENRNYINHFNQFKPIPEPSRLRMDTRAHKQLIDTQKVHTANDFHASHFDNLRLMAKKSKNWLWWCICSLHSIRWPKPVT